MEDAKTEASKETFSSLFPQVAYAFFVCIFFGHNVLLHIDAYMCVHIYF